MTRWRSFEILRFAQNDTRGYIPFFVIPKLAEESCGIATYFLALFYLIQQLPLAKISPFRYRSSKAL
jgi:hypothetical protein